MHSLPYELAAAIMARDAIFSATDFGPVLMNSNASRYGRGPKRRKTGITYPHSSDRQEARYARQLAAGQIKA